MSARPTVNEADLSRIVTDILQRDAGREFDEWVEREGFEPAALVGLVRVLTETALASGQSLEPILLGAFALGWDVHRSLRGEVEVTLA